MPTDEQPGSDPGSRLGHFGEVLRLRERYAKLNQLQRQLRGVGVSTEIERLRRQIETTEADAPGGDVWNAVELARHRERPYTLDYVERLFDDFVELRGDRAEMDDQAIVAGLGRFRGRTVALVGHQKGRDIHENVRRRFGMAPGRCDQGYPRWPHPRPASQRHSLPRRRTGSHFSPCGRP